MSFIFFSCLPVTITDIVWQQEWRPVVTLPSDPKVLNSYPDAAIPTRVLTVWGFQIQIREGSRPLVVARVTLWPMFSRLMIKMTCISYIWTLFQFQTHFLTKYVLIPLHSAGISHISEPKCVQGCLNSTIINCGVFRIPCFDTDSGQEDENATEDLIQ